MRLILLSDILNVGRRGEVVDTKPGYARNFLIPQGLAVLATDANENWFAHQRKKIEARNAKERDEASQIAARLDGKRLDIRKRAGESDRLYGSVTATDVDEALLAAGFEVDRRQIDLGGGIKELGEHEIRVLLHPEVTAVLTVNVEREE